MKRAAIATLVVCIAATSHADSPRIAASTSGASSSATAPKPDEIADIEAREANLESKEPREGLTFAGALGVGLLVGGDIGVGRGPAVSLRLGHVATRRSVITFELNIGSGLHKPSQEDPALADSNYALLAGVQRYTSRIVWLRAAGGVTAFVEDAEARTGTGGKEPVGGLAALVGAGLDIWRVGRYFVLGIETAGIGTISGDGFKLQLGFSLGLSYY